MKTAVRTLKSKMSRDEYQAGNPGTTVKVVVTKILETKNARATSRKLRIEDHCEDFDEQDVEG